VKGRTTVLCGTAYFFNLSKCYFRYSPKYHILELVSDYYNKVPIFYHFSDGIYEKHNGIEYIKDIDY
jgi:hypothetical protein